MGEENIESKPMQKKNNRRHHRKKKANKLVLTFDENARREFLTGFHKRKLQRKNKAKEEFEKQLKLERKRIKAKAKEEYKKLLLTERKQMPDFNDLLSEKIDMGSHSVTVTELSNSDIAKKNNWIGVNEVQYEERICSEEPNPNQEKQSKVEGMEMEKSTKNKKVSTKTDRKPKSCKDIKKKIKHQVALDVKNSKIFKKKAKLETIKNIKLQKKQERRNQKHQKKDKRTKHKKT